MSRDLDPDDREPSASSASPSRVPGGDSESPTPESLTGASRSASGSDSAAPERDREPAQRTQCPDPFATRHPDPYRVLLWRDRVVAVSPSEQATLRTLGTFRTVARNDLAQHRYGGERGRLDRDVRSLERRHWVEAHTLPGRFGGRSSVVLTLTREGHAFARRYLARDQQQFQWGMVRPREQEHDTALYRMAAAEAARLSKTGATIRRVILDAELKGQLAAARNRPVRPLDDLRGARGSTLSRSRSDVSLASTLESRVADAALASRGADTERDRPSSERSAALDFRTAPDMHPDRDVTADGDRRAGERDMDDRTAHAERTQAIADSLHLKVVDGVVQVPDLRLEVEHPDGTIARVDLELATEHYKPGQLAAKARAGFTIYAPAHQTGRLTAALHDRGIMADILSL